MVEDEGRKKKGDYVRRLTGTEFAKANHQLAYPSASLSISQWLELKRNKLINISFTLWAEQCWQHCLQLLGFLAFALHLDKSWQAKYVFCPVPSHTACNKKDVWQKFPWNLGCLRSASFPWGNLKDKGGQPQQKLTHFNSQHCRYEYTLVMAG